MDIALLEKSRVTKNKKPIYEEIAYRNYAAHRYLSEQIRYAYTFNQSPHEHGIDREGASEQDKVSRELVRNAL